MLSRSCPPSAGHITSRQFYLQGLSDMTYGLRINSSYLFVSLASLDRLIRTSYGVSPRQHCTRSHTLVYRDETYGATRKTFCAYGTVRDRWDITFDTLAPSSNSALLSISHSSRFDPSPLFCQQGLRLPIVGVRHPPLFRSFPVRSFVRQQSSPRGIELAHKTRLLSRIRFLNRLSLI